MWEPYFHLIWRSSWKCEGLRPTWLLDKSSKAPFFHCQSLSQRCRVSIAMCYGNSHINIFGPCYMIMRLDTDKFISIYRVSQKKRTFRIIQAHKHILQLIVNQCNYWSINSSCNCKRYSSSSSLLSMKWICLANKNNIKYCFVVKRKLWFGRGSYFGVDADFRCVDANFRWYMPFQSVVRLCKAFFHVCLLKFLRAKSGYC